MDKIDKILDWTLIALIVICFTLVIAIIGGAIWELFIR